jgi:uncharacterized protein YndB with AHSA1/START domain
MGNTEFVYTTYINATPERVWQALTDPAFTRRYWGATFESDWEVGSAMTWEQDGVAIADPAQVVLESEPCRRLVYSWHTFTPEFAEKFGFSDEFLAKVNSERRSKVTFDIEPVGQLVKLTVVHDDFEPGSTVLESISQGWPAILASLKTLLETGDSLPFSADTALAGEQSLQP